MNCLGLHAGIKEQVPGPRTIKQKKSQFLQSRLKPTRELLVPPSKSAGKQECSGKAFRCKWMPMQSLSMVHFFLWAVRAILVLGCSDTPGLSMYLHTNLHGTSCGKYMRVWQRGRLFHAFFMREISINWNNSLSQTPRQRMTRRPVYIWIVQPALLGFPTFRGCRPVLSVDPFFFLSSIKKERELFQDLPGKHILTGNSAWMGPLEKQLPSQ